MTLLRSLAALAVFFCVLGSPAVAVLHVSSGGSDLTGDGSSDAPFKTIQHAVDMALTLNDTISVGSGTYDECVNAVNPLGLRIVAENPDPAQTKIRGDNVCTTVEIGGPGAALIGFKIEQGGDSAVYAVGSVEIADNLIINSNGTNGGGIRVRSDTCAYGPATVTITGNEISGNNSLNDGAGISIELGDSDLLTMCADITALVQDNSFTSNISSDDSGGLEIVMDSLAGFSVEATVAENTFLTNSAADNGGAAQITLWGAGDETLIVRDNTFQQNTAGDDSGALEVEMDAPSARSGNVTIVGNEFLSNESADSAGGAKILLLGNGTERAVVRENTFQGNIANGQGGGLDAGIYALGAADFDLLVEDNLFTGNTAAQNGGGIYADMEVVGLSSLQSYRTVIRGNTLTGNSSTGARFGGGGMVARYQSDETVESSAALAEFLVADNIITGNSTYFSGGGLSVVVETNVAPPPGICLEAFKPSTAKVDVVNNLITGNLVQGAGATEAGGGVASLARACFASLSDVSLRHNTIADNQIGTGPTGGMALGFSSQQGGFGRQVVSHSIVSGNQGYGIGGVVEGTSFIIDVDHSNVYGNLIADYEPWIGNRTGYFGNISLAPEFEDPLTGDYRLTLTSPAVDAGNRVPGVLPATDFEGDPRVIDGDVDGDPVLDMGYDELFICTDLDHDGYGDPILAGDFCTADNCPEDYNPGQSDCDFDLLGDVCDPDSTDGDLDGVDDGCDDVPGDPNLCGDADADDCDDCSSGIQNPRNDGQDSDYDGLCDVGDLDDDSDGVEDTEDIDPLDPGACRDQEGDGCDDCSAGGPFDIFDDGTDSDGDGFCDIGDSSDFDPEICGVDHDADTCDDCGGGTYDPASDGADFDADGACDDGDPDDDNDSVVDGEDEAPFDQNACRDVDADSCDDCTSGTDAPTDDGADFDLDGACDAGDPDDDNDGILDPNDPDDQNADVCGDSDGDLCDDCTIGTDDTGPLGDSDPFNDGVDFEGDGLCDLGDPDDDNDGVADGEDSDPFNANLCGDVDNDGCEDCVNGSFDPSNDGVDFEGDGLCDLGDPDDDNDAVADGDDSAPFDNTICRDLDVDGCDDCSSGVDAPENDGEDFDADGLCDPGDPDDDNDTIEDGEDTDPFNPLVCQDLDSDGCDDCANNTGGPAETVLSEDFDVDAGSFGYVDDAFRGTVQPAYADGYHDIAAGQTGGGLVVEVGGVDDTDLLDMSGGWTQTFDLAATSEVVLTFHGNLTIVAAYEPDELGQLLLSVDGVLVGQGGNDYLAEIVGGSASLTTGWQLYQVNLGTLDAGSHTLTIGGYNNKKTTSDEITEVSIDDVLLELPAVPLGPDPDNDGVDFDADGTCDPSDTDDDNDGILDPDDPDDQNADICGDVDADGCDDCAVGSDDLGPLSDSDPANDGDDFDVDGLCDLGDPDDDNDNVADGDDNAPFDANLCRDVDNDSCDDCSSGTDDPANDGDDFEGDGLCDLGDPDDDNDGVVDGDDSAPFDANLCRDVDSDGCDDCSSGTDDPVNDGDDFDADGACDLGDADDDNDGIADLGDIDTLNPDICGDVDSDGCDDCAVGTDDLGPQSDSDPANDGDDFEGDGLCDLGDPDDDNDNVADGEDDAPFDANACRDADSDNCDDCSSGTDDPANDGDDFEGDGLCDLGDPDDDNDNVADGDDNAPFDATACRDTDGDSCDDCSSGTDDPANDGADFEGDGLCDLGDPDDDNDNVADGDDNAPFDATACRDTDGDSCDDCSSGTDDPANDGADFEGDGLCDLGDPDDDNDSVADGDDSAPFNGNVCRDLDNDDCDDCSSGTDDPANDGADFDGDGLCDEGDPDDDNDTVADGDDDAPFDVNACRDVDGDLCDDCSTGTDAPLNDGADFDGDGFCDLGDPDDDNDGALDGADCAQFVNSVSEPAGDLGATLRFGSTTTELHWVRIAHANVYNIWRGTFGGGAPFGYDHTCFDSEVPARVTSVTDDPAPGSGHYYLVAGSNVCGGGGSLGTDSSSLERPQNGSCATLGNDGDSDGVLDINDSCPGDANPAQSDADIDGVGDICDNCPVPNSDQRDLDGDGPGDACDTCTDVDDDGFGNPGFSANDCEIDNCPSVPNVSQDDNDSDGFGDACDICSADPDDDLDGDGVCGDVDNCPDVVNRAQLDFDLDGEGDLCDTCTDVDDDGFGDLGFAGNLCPDDNCPVDSNPLQDDSDTDGVGDACDICPDDFDPGQTDADGDLIGDYCDVCVNNPDTGCLACPDGTDPDGDGSCLDEVAVIEFGSATTYLGNQVDPALDLTWTTFAFVPDGSWSAGSFGVGFETIGGAENLIQTPVTPGTSSIYTRTTFEVADPLLVQRVAIAADYDDGYVAWLNGVEIYRSPEMPEDDPLWNTIPGGHESSNGTVADYGTAIDVTGVASLQTGTNVLALGVWNRGTNSSDLVVVPRLSLASTTDNCPSAPNPNQADGDGDGVGDTCDICPAQVDPLQVDSDGDGFGDACDPCAYNPDIACLACPPGTDPDGDGVCQNENPVVEQGSGMTYLANEVDPAIGITWTADSFVPDANWQAGSYGVGFDRLGAATDLLDTVVSENVASVYTRAEFEIADVTLVDRVLLGADYDDGYIAWINGVEVYRSPEVPVSGDPAWNMGPSPEHESSNSAEPLYSPIADIGASDLLRDGTNVIAIGVWNAHVGSSDLVLVPRLAYTTASDNCPEAPNPGQEDSDGDGIGDACDWETDDPPSTVELGIGHNRKFGPVN